MKKFAIYNDKGIAERKKQLLEGGPIKIIPRAPRNKSAAQGKNMMDEFSSGAGIKKDMICQMVEECEGSPVKHRHSTERCLTHVFCHQDPILPVDGDHKVLPEKMPLTGSREFDRMKQHILFPRELGGAFAGHDQLVKEANQQYHFFGNDRDVNAQGLPKDRKLVITDELLNEWLASQWENFSLQNVPLNKPLGMDAALHKRFLNQCYQIREEQNKTKLDQVSYKERNLQEETNKKLGPLIDGSFTSKTQKAQEKSQKVVLSCDIVPRLPQNTFKVATYGKDAEYVSFVDEKLKEAERRKEEEERQREIRRLLKQKEMRQNMGPKTPQSPSMDASKLLLRKQTISSDTELLQQLQREQQAQNELQVKQKMSEGSTSKLSFKELRLQQLKSRVPPYFSVTVKSSLPEQGTGETPVNRYKQPNRTVRKRLQSEYLNKMMNQSEIENLVEKITQYEQGMYNRRSQGLQLQRPSQPQQEKDIRKSKSQSSMRRSVKQEATALQGGGAGSAQHHQQSKGPGCRQQIREQQLQQIVANLSRQIQSSMDQRAVLQTANSNESRGLAKTNLSSQDQPRTRNMNQTTMVETSHSALTKRWTQSQASHHQPKSAFQTRHGSQLEGNQVARHGQAPNVADDTLDRSELLARSLNQNTGIFKRFTKTSSFNQRAKRALFGSELKKYGAQGSDLGTPGQSAHARGKKSAMSMVGKSEMFEKIQSSKIDKLREENDYTVLSTPSKNRQHQLRQPPPNQRNENDTYLMSQGSKNEKAFDIFNSNVQIDGSPRVKTVISHKDFFALFKKSGGGESAQKSGGNQSKTDELIQSLVSRPVDPQAITTIKESMPTHQRKSNQNLVAEIQHKRRLENILNQNYQLDVNKIEMPGHLKHLDERTIASQAHQSTQAGTVGPSSTHLSSAKSAVGSHASQSNTVLNSIIGDIKKSTQFQGKGFQKPGKKLSKNDLLRLNHQSSTRLPTEQDQEQQETPVQEPKNLEEALENCTSELRKAIINDLNNGICVLSDKEKQAQRKYLKGDPKNNLNIDIQVKKLSVTETISKVYKKGFQDYRFWLQKSQLAMRHPNDWEPALDYLASGLRELPLSLDMLYNYACINEKLGRPDIALKFFRHARELRPRWTDALFGEAVTHFKLGNYRKSQESIGLAIANFKEDSAVDLGVMLYFQAMCYKKLGDFKKARRDYVGLLALYRQSEGMTLLNHVIACVLLPLNEDRKYQFEFMESTLQLIQFFQPSPPLESYARLDQSKCLMEGSNQLANNLFLVKMLQMRPFFNRFNQETLKKYAPYGTVEYFDKDDIIFLNGRVGVITHGSVRVFSHQDDIMDPATIGRFKAGRILGHGDTDKNITLHSQTWLVVFDPSTEIVFFPKDQFDELWSLQSMNHQKTILNYVLDKNRFWKILSRQTQLELVHNGLEVRKFLPGELICRMNKRSPLARTVFGKFNQSNTAKFKDELEKARSLEQRSSYTRNAPSNLLGKASIQESIKKGRTSTQETVLQGFVRTLTSVNPGETKLMQAISPELQASIQTTLDYNKEQKKKAYLKSPSKLRNLKVPVSHDNSDGPDEEQSSPEKQTDLSRRAKQLKQIKSPEILINDPETHAKEILEAEKNIDEQVDNYMRYKEQAEHLFKSLNPEDEQDEHGQQGSNSQRHDDHQQTNDDGAELPKQKLSVLRKPRRVHFDTVMQKILQSYGDQIYQEADGLYIIFYGHIDVVNPFTRKKIYQLGINENFGETNLVKHPGMEYMGDVYAGLYPQGKPAAGAKRAKRRMPKSIVPKETQEGGNVVAVDSPDGERSELLRIIEEKEECVLCLFVPQMRLEQIVPGNERRELERFAQSDAKREGLVHLMAGIYNVDSQVLQQI